MVEFFAGYRPHPKQAAVHGDGARFLAASAGTRGGKTAGMAREFLKRIYLDEQRLGPIDRVYWVVTPTYKIGAVARKMLLTICQEPWARAAAKRWQADYRAGGKAWPQDKKWKGKGIICNWNKQASQLYLIGGNNRGHGDGPSNILIEFRTTTDPEALVAEGLYGLWMDEAARCKAAAWRGGLRQRLTDRQGWALFSTTPMGRNWYHSEIHLRGELGAVHWDEDYSSHAWRTVDNTALPGLAAEVERARQQMPMRYFRREYEASFAAFQGQIYDEWTPRIHVGQVNPHRDYYDRVVAGLDFGWIHPGCLSVWGIREPREGEPRRRSYALIYERHEPRLEVIATEAGGDSWARTIYEAGRRWCGDPRRLIVYADPARPDHIAQLQRAQLWVTEAENAVVEGIECVAKAMHPVGGECPFFTVTESAEGFRANAEAYSWKSDGDDDETEQPVKKHDDAADAARYALYSDAEAHPLVAA